jgi:hypothetical protein
MSPPTNNWRYRRIENYLYAEIATEKKTTHCYRCLKFNAKRLLCYDICIPKCQPLLHKLALNTNQSINQLNQSIKRRFCGGLI